MALRDVYRGHDHFAGTEALFTWTGVPARRARGVLSVPVSGRAPPVAASADCLQCSGAYLNESWSLVR